MAPGRSRYARRLWRPGFSLIFGIRFRAGAGAIAAPWSGGTANSIGSRRCRGGKTAAAAGSAGRSAIAARAWICPETAFPVWGGPRQGRGIGREARRATGRRALHERVSEMRTAAPCREVVYVRAETGRHGPQDRRDGMPRLAIAAPSGRRGTGSASPGRPVRGLRAGQRSDRERNLAPRSVPGSLTPEKRRRIGRLHPFWDGGRRVSGMSIDAR